MATTICAAGLGSHLAITFHMNLGTMTRQLRLSLVIAAAMTSLVAARPDESPELRLQVGLDRAGFSAGEIDGRRGTNTTRALEAFAHARGLRIGDESAIARALSDNEESVLTTYTITAADAAGPFTPDIPRDIEQQATLDALNYRTIDEEVGEKFHASPALLARLNPGVTLQEGAEIQVPNVRIADDDTAPKTHAAKVTVSRSRSAATAYDAADKVIFYAPVTSGSTHDPLPLGAWKVTGVERHPTFNYNPDLFWDADPSHTKAKIPAGPNNPVGVVWIDINKPHYGLHGTPEPSAIARTTSHGCVRLTNWDALRLASLVRPGTPVIFEK